jgi:choline-sulfatase
MEACRVIRDHEVAGDPRPLFLVVSFYSPHDPYVMPADRLAPYLDCDDEPVDPTPEALPSYAQERLQAFGWDAATRRRARAAYRAKTQFLDEQLESVTAAWRESPLAADAVTVYTSDHGDLQGEHGLWAKGCYYDGAARVPLVLRAPGRVAAGTVVDRPVGLVDLAPTLLELAGAPPLPEASGRSFWSALRSGGGAWPDCVYSEQASAAADEASRMVRRGPWKYIHYTGHEAELYNLEEDPGECVNLAGEPRHAETRRRLHELLVADGWDPEAIRRHLRQRAAEYQYLYRYARALEPRDPLQWGLPAQL